MNLFKKPFVRLCLLIMVSILSLNPSNTKAQTGDLFFGQEHSYTVIFRGNGEAVVYGKIDFTNTSDIPVKTFTLEIPSVKPSEFMALQSLYSPITSNCPGYPNLPPSAYCPSTYEYDYGYNRTQPQPYINSSDEYQQLKFKVTGTVYELQLQQEVQPKQKTSFVFAYVASGYVSKSLGVYKFTYETPRVNSRIKSINVSVDVDSELVLKGKKSEVNYATNEISASIDSSLRSGMADSFSSPQFKNAVSQIGAGGPIQKNAQNLAPNESLKVNGEYAKNKWTLGWFSLTWKILLALFVIIGSFILIRRWYKKRPLVKNDSTVANSTGQENAFHFLHPLYTSVGFGSTALILGITFGVYSLLRYGAYSNIDGFIIIIAILITGLFILVAAILPPVIIGMRFGWRAGVSVIANILIWMTVLILLYTALRLYGVWPTITPTPPPYYGY